MFLPFRGHAVYLIQWMKNVAINTEAKHMNNYRNKPSTNIITSFILNAVNIIYRYYLTESNAQHLIKFDTLISIQNVYERTHFSRCIISVDFLSSYYSYVLFIIK